jgi:hypothetical protein
MGSRIIKWEVVQPMGVGQWLLGVGVRSECQVTYRIFVCLC